MRVSSWRCYNVFLGNFDIADLSEVDLEPWQTSIFANIVTDSYVTDWIQSNTFVFLRLAVFTSGLFNFILQSINFAFSPSML